MPPSAPEVFPTLQAQAKQQSAGACVLCLPFCLPPPLVTALKIKQHAGACKGDWGVQQQHQHQHQQQPPCLCGLLCWGRGSSHTWAAAHRRMPLLLLP
jgi:hypothetical protein